MKEQQFEVIENKKIGIDVYRLVLKGDTKEISCSGEFVELQLENKFLRRPFSVCDYTNETLTILYKVLGFGTKDMTSFSVGKKVNLLIGLGNGFNHNTSKMPLLIGGGIGTAPLYNLAKKFRENGIKPKILLCFKTMSEVFYTREFEELGEVCVLTDDGSQGYKGNAITYLKSNNVEYDFYFACGPLGMLKALSAFQSCGYLSLEARMGCGFGACMGCSIETTNGVKRVCKEGPVFEASEVIW